MPGKQHLLAVLASAVLALAAHAANAQATRTWVSGVGDDANPCSRTAPCKTFAGAISKTAAGGEINALDPGGFGAVTITKSITIDGGGGQVASVLAAATNGIVISAAGAVVTLRNLRIHGVVGTPSPGLNGVQFLSGATLHIENCAIFGFSQTGININLSSASAARVLIRDTVVSNSNTGVAARNAGAGGVFVSLLRTTLAQNGTGLRADGGGGASSIIATAIESSFDGNGTGVLAIGGTLGNAGVQIERSSIINNTTTGAVANGSAGLKPIIFFSNSVIATNGTGVSSVGGGTLSTYQNNVVDGNGVNGSFTNTIAPQ
jgi:hypothetical protein